MKKKYTTFELNSYNWRIVYSNDVESAKFNIDDKVIYMNPVYTQNEEMYIESIRHEIFEIIMAMLSARFISLDMNDNCFFNFPHKAIDILLGMYHGALNSLK